MMQCQKNKIIIKKRLDLRGKNKRMMKLPKKIAKTI